MDKAQITQRAEMAARKVAQLQEMYEDRKSGFGILGTNIGGASWSPNIHIYEDTLDTISDRNAWTWEWVSNSDGEHMYFRATVELWGITFQAVFDNSLDDNGPHEAEKYGCPEEVLNEFNANS